MPEEACVHGGTLDELSRFQKVLKRDRVEFQKPLLEENALFGHG